MNYWKVATFSLVVVLAGLLCSGLTVMAQARRKAHITAVGVQKYKGNVPYIGDLDGLDVDLPSGGEIKGFSCVRATAEDFNGENKAVPQCYIVTQ
jgi:hypothetical protein